MAAGMITIDYKKFDELKNNAKTLEYYWMRYRSQNELNDEDEFAQYVEVIENFIHTNKYEELKMVKVNFRGTKVKMTEKNYQELQEFSNLAYLIKSKIK